MTTQTTKPNREIKLSFFPSGYNGLDVFVNDFWSVELKVKNKHASAEFFVHAPETSKQEVLHKAQSVLAMLKDAAK